MKYSLKERIFIIEAGKYVERVIERHLYNEDSSVESKQNCVNICFKDVFQDVFTMKFRGNERVVTGWRNAGRSCIFIV